MEIKKHGRDGAIKEALLKYLLWSGKENKYRLARVFKIGTEEVIEVLQALENERKIEMEGGKAKPITALRKKATLRKKEMERGAEKVEEVEASPEAEESEKGVGQWLADMK